MAAREHRVAMTAAAGDVLPSGDLIRSTKRLAFGLVGATLADLPWPPRREVHERVDLVPFLALAALIELCPGVRPERLARCLGLDPLDVPEGLATERKAETWPAEVLRPLLEMLRKEFA